MPPLRGLREAVGVVSTTDFTDQTGKPHVGTTPSLLRRQPPERGHEGAVLFQPLTSVPFMGLHSDIMKAGETRRYFPR